jgi:hypothetical protein
MKLFIMQFSLLIASPLALNILFRSHLSHSLSLCHDVLWEDNIKICRKETKYEDIKIYRKGTESGGMAWIRFI